MASGKTVTVLSIDGGGIRGIIPAMVMAEIADRTGKPIHELFDLMAGSSTGGLLALAMSVPDADGAPRYTAADLPDLYMTYSKLIFSRTRWDAILSMDNWRFRRYPNVGIGEALTEVFGEATLRDALTDVLVTSYDIERRQPWFFRSTRARTDDDCNFEMRHVIRATTAAPTFFEPARLPNNSDADAPFSLIDGSMTAINPALCAYVEARETHPEADDFVVVSLGTGNLTQPLSFDEVRGWGLLNWARPLTDIMFNAASHTVDHQLRQLVPYGPDGEGRYFRLQKRIEGVDHRMDDISEMSLAMIHEWGAELIAEQSDQIDQLSASLLAAWEEKQAPQRGPGRFFSFPSLAFWRSKPTDDDNTPTDDNDDQVAQTG